jgi:hypothetical protein
MHKSRSVEAGLARCLKPEFGTRTLDVARQGGLRETPRGDLFGQAPLK